MGTCGEQRSAPGRRTPQDIRCVGQLSDSTNLLYKSLKVSWNLHFIWTPRTEHAAKKADELAKLAYESDWCLFRMPLQHQLETALQITQMEVSHLQGRSFQPGVHQTSIPARELQECREYYVPSSHVLYIQVVRKSGSEHLKLASPGPLPKHPGTRDQ